METLQRAAYAPPRGPVVLVIMDGIGIGKYSDGDAVRSALKPHLDWLATHALSSQLKAHGRAVGLPSDADMGNSEVGHNAIGCGRVFDQGAKLVNAAIQSGAMFQGGAWTELIQNCREHESTLHFIGLLSDGNVHSHVEHLRAMLIKAKEQKVRRARIHILLDGRDVGETSALEYVDSFERFLAELNASGEVDYAIASGGGRMVITMDRYNADWGMVQRGWDTHRRGLGPQFASARQAITAHRQAHPGIIDQDLPPFVIAADAKPIGPILDNDSVIYFNFRGDRSIEISRAFEEDKLVELNRDPRPKVLYAGMMQYDGDLQIPKRFLVKPPAINRTMGEFLAHAGVPQLAVSETQKFGHVTYFFNGNRSGKFDARLEEYLEVPSDIVPFEQRPWMKAAEITDKVVAAIQARRFPFIRLNYPNGDMVGHTGVFQASQIAVESVDLCIGRLIRAVTAAQGILVVSSDHGNADDMLEHDKKTGQAKLDPDTGKPKVKTSHSLNPVPLFIYDPAPRSRWKLTQPPAAKQNSQQKGEATLGISSLAATCLTLLGFIPPSDYDPSIVQHL